MARLILHRPEPAGGTRSEPARVTSAAEALAAIEAWGALLLFPAREAPVPSLWELWRGRRGPMASMGWEEVADVLAWKEEIAGRRAALFSRWLDGRQAFMSLDLLPALLRLRTGVGPSSGGGRPAKQAETDAQRIATALGERGPLLLSELRRAAGLGGRAAGDRFNAALEPLERRLVVANLGAREPEDGWAEDLFELVETAFPEVVAASAGLDDAAARRRAARVCDRLAAWGGTEPASIARLIGIDAALPQPSSG